MGPRLWEEVLLGTYILPAYGSSPSVRYCTIASRNLTVDSQFVQVLSYLPSLCLYSVMGSLRNIITSDLGKASALEFTQRGQYWMSMPNSTTTIFQMNALQ